MKTCSKCKCTKDVAEFRWRYKAKGILQPYCKSCNVEYHKKWYNDNKDHVRKDNRRRRISYRTEINNWIFNYFKTNPYLYLDELQKVVQTTSFLEGDTTRYIVVL